MTSDDSYDVPDLHHEDAEPAPAFADIEVVRPAAVDPVPQPLADPPAPKTRRRATAMAAAVLLVGSGIAGGAALGLNRGDAGAATSTSQAQTTTPGSTGTFDDGGFARGGRAIAPQFDPSTTDGGVAGATSTQETAADATSAQSVGLVEISSTLTNGRAAGTGLILSADGTVVTNHHVVAGSTSLKVTVVSTGATYTARYIGGDATTDVAVLQLVGASGLTPVTVASSPASTGDSVTAVGDAGGDGGSLTASPGTVSALAQDITVQDESGTPANLADLIQLAAYVVPGDSGGAVLNSAGQVVGMNVAASSGRGAVSGYAIPVSTVVTTADEILAGKTTSSVDGSAITLGYGGYLGVGLDPSATRPVVTQVVNDGPAAAAGITSSDTITALNGTTVRSATQLRALLAKADAGDRATVTWTTAAGTTRSATVTLGRAPIG